MKDQEEIELDVDGNGDENAENKETCELKASDIVVRKYNVNQGMKEKNPLQWVSFYVEEDGYYKIIPQKLEDISLMMPEKC